MSPEAFLTCALERYERPLVSYAKAITGDLESARDAVQETFLRLSRQDLDAIEPRLAPWLFFVCRNCALDHRRKVVRLTHSVDDAVPDPGPNPSDEAGATEDAAQLRSLVARLPENQREIVRLKYDAGLTCREIAEVMKTTANHVGVQLHNAIVTLRAQWQRANTEILP